MTTKVINGNSYSFPDDFDNYGFRTAFPNLIDDLLAVAELASAAGTQNGYTTTSSTSYNITTDGTGSFTFTVDSGKGYVAGQVVKIASQADAETDFVIATVTSYSGTSLQVNVTSTNGSGAHTDWRISIKTGDVGGPSSSTDGSLAFFDGTTGKLLDGSSWALDGSGNLVSPTTNKIVTVSNNSITLEPHGTGKTKLNKTQFQDAIDCNDKTLNKSSVRQISDASVGSGTHTLDYANGDAQKITATGDFTIAVSNFPTGNVVAFVIEAVNWGAHTITLPAGWKFSQGETPVFTSSGTDRVMLLKDGNDVYEMYFTGKNVST